MLFELFPYILLTSPFYLSLFSTLTVLYIHIFSILPILQWAFTMALAKGLYRSVLLIASLYKSSHNSMYKKTKNKKHLNLDTFCGKIERF